MVAAAGSEKVLVEALIRFALIFALMAFCYHFVHPFLNLMLWSLVLAVTLYPLHRKLERKLGKSGRAATLIVLVSIAVLAVPVYFLAMSIADSAERGIAVVKSGALRVPPPNPSVATWPLVGERLYALWLEASTDLTGLAQKAAPEIKDVSLVLLGKFAGFSLGLLTFLASLILAGIFMAYGAGGRRSTVQIASRLVGPDRGEHVTELCTATIRAVAQGVIGIAFIQAALIGLGFVIKGIPGAGLLIMAVLLLGITQLPATLITVPVIIYVFASEGATVAAIVFSVYVFVAGLADNVLKPLLLGRGVEVPMPVILIGALGGMVTNGIIGLFIGPVVLAVGYELFWTWVRGEVGEGMPAGEGVSPAEGDG
jgi:predicted PurR-regulated permease PerM